MDYFERLAAQETIDFENGEDYCDLCEREGHTFRTCQRRDDDYGEAAG